MAATQDIVATYKGPGKVVRRLLARGPQESSVLIYLMIACLLVFVAQTPRLARQAFETGEELNMLLGATLMSWLFVAPLLLYALAGIIWLIGRIFRTALSAYGARLALFWALLASTPIILLWGLTAGFVGPGIQMNLVGAIWCAVFLWFCVSGVIAAGKGPA